MFDSYIVSIASHQIIATQISDFKLITWQYSTAHVSFKSYCNRRLISSFTVHVGFWVNPSKSLDYILVLLCSCIMSHLTLGPSLYHNKNLNALQRVYNYNYHALTVGISWIWPRYGSIAGGTTVNIYGSGFATDSYTSANIVYFDDIPCIVEW